MSVDFLSFESFQFFRQACEVWGEFEDFLFKSANFHQAVRTLMAVNETFALRFIATENNFDIEL